MLCRRGCYSRDNFKTRLKNSHIRIKYTMELQDMTMELLSLANETKIWYARTRSDVQDQTMTNPTMVFSWSCIW